MSDQKTGEDQARDELLEVLGDGFLDGGARPRFPEIPRWVRVADVPQGVELPPIPRLVARRATGPITVDGALSEPDWAAADWSGPFGAITSGEPSTPETRVAFLWDDEALYAGYRVEQHDIRAYTTRHHEHVYVKDDDAELFVGGEGRYFEIGINPVNTIYEIGWYWLEPLVRAQDFDMIEALMRVNDQFYYARRGGERLGRLADLGWELPGLERAVRVDGAINAPHVRDNGWTVEFKLPWAGLATLMPEHARHRAGDVLRVQAYRAFHARTDPALDAKFAAQFPGSTHWSSHTLSAMGSENVHNPERWAFLELGG
ncbi:MAG: carbohydrate-binding family 9-like protein [Chloroflexota bacterium]